MSIALVTGSAGLIGSETCRSLSGKGMEIVGIDNDMRAEFFGTEASTASTRARLEQELSNYRHHAIDIRDADAVHRVFKELGSAIQIVVHTAAQPSHDWAAKSPATDFGVNALGTLNLLEATRLHCPDAVFIFTSTNKVYGDTPNRLPLVELDKRWEIAPEHLYRNGIDETMSIDQTKHSLFGASKVAADVLVQEYGRYFGMKTGCFRGGWVPHRPRPRRHRAPRIPGLPHEMHGHRKAVPGFWLQRQTGPRQHPQPRSGERILGILPGPASRRSL